MAYDPDLEPILAAIHARLDAQDARLDKLEGGTVTPPSPAPGAPPAAAQPIWMHLKQSQMTIPAELRLPPGTREFYIPITVDHADRESFYCYVSGFSNISGGKVNVGNLASQRANFSEWEGVVYRWSPGDDRTHNVKVATRSSYADGQSLSLIHI